MATFKFFNIGKSNEEIARLEGELVVRDQQVLTLVENQSAVEAQATQLAADLSTAKQTIGTLTSEREALAANVTALTTASEITAAQGVPGVAIAPTASQTGKPEPKTWAEKAVAAAEAKAAARQ